MRLHYIGVLVAFYASIVTKCPRPECGRAIKGFNRPLPDGPEYY
jgi:hypothetical protein